MELAYTQWMMLHVLIGAGSVDVSAIISHSWADCVSSGQKVTLVVHSPIHHKEERPRAQGVCGGRSVQRAPMVLGAGHKGKADRRVPATSALELHYSPQDDFIIQYVRQSHNAREERTMRPRCA